MNLLLKDTLARSALFPGFAAQACAAAFTAVLLQAVPKGTPPAEPDTAPPSPAPLQGALDPLPQDIPDPGSGKGPGVGTGPEKAGLRDFWAIHAETGQAGRPETPRIPSGQVPVPPEPTGEIKASRQSPATSGGAIANPEITSVRLPRTVRQPRSSGPCAPETEDPSEGEHADKPGNAPPALDAVEGSSRAGSVRSLNPEVLAAAAGSLIPRPSELPAEDSGGSEEHATPPIGRQPVPTNEQGSRAASGRSAVRSDAPIPDSLPAREGTPVQEVGPEISVWEEVRISESAQGPVGSEEEPVLAHAEQPAGRGGSDRRPAEEPFTRTVDEGGGEYGVARLEGGRKETHSERPLETPAPRTHDPGRSHEAVPTALPSGREPRGERVDVRGATEAVPLPEEHSDYTPLPHRLRLEIPDRRGEMVRMEVRGRAEGVWARVEGGQEVAQVVRTHESSLHQALSERGVVLLGLEVGVLAQDDGRAQTPLEPLEGVRVRPPRSSRPQTHRTAGAVDYVV